MNRNSLKIQVEKINGLSDSKNACGVFSKRVTTSTGEVGILTGCVLVRDVGSLDSQLSLHKFFEIFSGKLEGAEDNVGEIFQGALDEARKFAEENKLNGNFAICAFFGGACYVARLGDKVKIHTFKGHKGQELKLDFGSGPYSQGQVFVIGSDKFFSTFDTNVLGATEQIDIADIVDGLATEISSDNAQSEIGVVFVKIGNESEAIKDSEDIKRNEKEVGEEVSYVSKGDESKPNEEVGEEVRAYEDTRLEQVMQQDRPIGEKKSGFSVGDLLGKVITLVAGEVGKLKRGDIKAIFRLRRNVVILAVVLLAILAASAYFKINTQMEAAKIASFEKQMQSAQTYLSEAEAILDLNREKARGKLIEADKNVQGALSIYPKNEEGNRLKAQISAKLKETESVASLPFEEIADLGKSLISISKGAKEIFGISDDKIFKVSKDGEVLDEFAGQEGTGDGYVFADNAFVIASGKIIKVDLKSDKIEEVGSASEFRDLAVFLGNVYVLSADQILKYIPVEDGYSSASLYLENKEAFSDASRFAIDLSIWVTNKDQILKYTRGKKEEFTISGLVGGEVSFGEIYTDSASDNLYVIDKLNGALLVINKDGLYQKAYQAKEFKNVASFIVDEAAGKVYISSGSKILEASL